MPPSRLLLLSFSLLFTVLSPAADDYQPGPDSKPQEGVPKGDVLKFEFKGSKIFPGTVRDYWVYVPKQYTPDTPACVHVNQDGIQNLAPVVFDNLIAKKEIPVLIGVFVMHGRVPAADPATQLDRFNRSVEYDGLGENYARFILEELLPQVEKIVLPDGRPIRLSHNGNDRSIGGSSSGAIAAFTAAWERPEAFSRVFSTIGTYVDQRGGNDYPVMIRKAEPKALRVFLQDGSNDANGTGGNWFLANQEMLSALEFAGYESNHVWGDGGHNGKHATAIFPDAMRWLWKDWPKAVTKGVGSKAPVMEVLGAGSEWQLVGEGYGFTEGPAVNAKGEVFFTDIPNSRIHKVGLDGKVSVFAENTGKANGLMFGPDGRLYACASGNKQIVAYDEAGKMTVIAEGIDSNDLCIGLNGNLYVTDPPHKQVWLIKPNGEKSVVDTNDKGGLAFPNGLRLTPDQSLLLVADMRGQFIWSYHIEADGKLSAKQPYHHLRIPDGLMESGADGMTLDTKGRLYVATHAGIQFCDQAGRVNGIIAKPQRKWLANVVFGGANFDELYACNGDKVFKRKTQVKGVRSAEAPIKPEKPRL
ncbi:MAG: SMP-30/gluconolactonase/LRE family protein [Prosthecobacter sp.]|uniref:SMP-30/gluconolactonase/LRE family protein n=1 Tax=Prosthecobacter sp. TaxID=1965333 RepID=UPI003BAE3601